MPLEELQLGHYQLVRLIGNGGMGEVYLADDRSTPRQMAVKVIRHETLLDADAELVKQSVRLFQREMKAVTMLAHPHILPVVDFGEEEVQRFTYTYMVMPYCQQGSLIDWVRKKNCAGILPPTDVASIVTQSAEALQHAHDHQLIHQDVKPSNFLIQDSADSSYPDLLLADFGIAKFTSATATSSQSVRGTPSYMAPEQWSGEAVTATDQYALAIMAYQLLVGSLPFQGTPMRIMHQHIHTQPVLPSIANPALPKDLDEVLLHALEKDPLKRFASISAFAHAFYSATSDSENTLTARGPDLHTYTIQTQLLQSEALQEIALDLEETLEPHSATNPALTSPVTSPHEPLPVPSSNISFLNTSEPLPTLAVHKPSKPRSLSQRTLFRSLGLVLLLIISSLGFFYTTHMPSNVLGAYTKASPIQDQHLAHATTPQITNTPAHPTPTQQPKPDPTTVKTKPAPTPFVSQPTPTSPPQPIAPPQPTTPPARPTPTLPPPQPTTPPARPIPTPSPTPLPPAPTPIPPPATSSVRILGNASNWNGYCQSIGNVSASLDGTTAYSWHCVTPSNQHVGLDMLSLCRWQYGDTQAVDRLIDYNSSSGWQCMTGGQKWGMATNWNGYCQSIGDVSASLDGSTGYDWRCVTPSSQHVTFTVSALCSWQYNLSGAIDRLANYFDPNSWECWG